MHELLNTHQHRWVDVMHGNRTAGYWPARRCTTCGTVQRAPFGEVTW